MGARAYGIGALARDTGCNIETIRYYEKIGLLAEPPRSAGGHRCYASSDADRLFFIVRSRELGFSVADVRQLLRLVDSGVSCEEVRSITMTHIGTIQARISDLKRLEAVLRTTAANCGGGDAPDCPIVDMLFGGERLN